jgi:hypothetical protein
MLPRARHLERTPELERLLGRLRRRLRRQVWLHGAGTLLAAVALWIVFAFLADWALHVPRAVRWAHLVVLFALPAAIAWRELVRHLRRIPPRDQMAVLYEREHPELRELLVSAVQLQERPQPGARPELVGEVLAKADARARTLRLEGVLDERRPALRFALGTALAALIAVASLAEAEHSSIFFARLFGGSARWPQRTHLTLSIPLPAGSAVARVEETPERTLVRVARGSDVPVLVRADGVVPDEVILHFGGGREVSLGSSGDGLFRTRLASCQEDLEFFATGGDDRDGMPRVFVEVLEPPDVSGLAISIEPPAYTGLAPRVEFDHDVQVLAGSRLRVAVLTSPPQARGSVRILPEDRLVPLEPASFPPRPSSQGGGEPQPGLGFELAPSDSLRFRFELSDSSGLSNPDPGLFAVQVVPDRRPEVSILAPARSEVDTVPGGLIALRARAEDDFGIAAMGWSAVSLARAHALAAAPGEPSPDEAPSGEAASEVPAREPVVGADLALTRLEGDPRAEPRWGSAVVGGTRIEVAALASSGAGEGEQYQIEVAAVDVRPARGDAPDPDGVGRATPVRVRVVGEDEFLRRLQDRLARVRQEAAQLEELQRQKARRTSELLSSMESDSPTSGVGGSDLAAALAGQRRVQGDADALSRELAAILEGVLYARIDEKAGALLEDIDARLARETDKGSHLSAWRELANGWKSGRLIAPGLAGQLVSVLDLALAISLDDTSAAAQALDRAAQAVDLARVHEGLREAAEHQALAQQHIEELLARLAEWDNYQSILQLTRDILGRQRSLRERTREAAGGGDGK